MVHRLRVIESRAWTIAVMFAMASAVMIGATAGRLPAPALVAGGGIALAVVSTVIAINMLSLGALRVAVSLLIQLGGVERQVLREVGAVLDDVEDELAKRRHR
jgi:hypothetical protein